MRALAFIVSFVLAFLLFSVQPIATKMVLPALGGTPAVWNTAMFTFQMLLLAGYAYAHLLSTRVALPAQWKLHGLLVLGSLALLPLSVHLTGDDAVVQAPIRHLATAFLMQIGLPFFVLSATAPLLQAWVARSNHPLKDTPYVLYSASNLGSMMGLLGYVALIEPQLTLTQQSEGWSGLYIVGVALLLFAGMRLARSAAPAEVVTSAPVAPLKRGQVAMWIWLAFLPSSLSLGVTSYITTDIASVPLIWVIPLALYLLSFVDAFRTRPIFVRIAMRIAPIFGMVAMLAYGFQMHRFSETFLFQIGVFALLAFALHGWLARFKPAPAQLTQFYFCMSIGGAAGGLLNALVAPMVLNETFEYPLSLLAASLTAFVLWQRADPKGEGSSLRYHVRTLAQVMGTVIVNTALMYVILAYFGGRWEQSFERIDTQTLMMSASAAGTLSLLLYRRYAKAFYACAAVGCVMLFGMAQGHVGMQTLFKERSFFGVWRVYDQREPHARFMMHNTTVHSVQSLDLSKPPETLSYYNALRNAFRLIPAAKDHPIGLLGLGAGTVKCLAREGQQTDIFEIDPMVVKLAEDPKMFRYLSECPGTHEVFLGDGRVMLGQRPDGRYGVIVMDAFSSDAIPSHLITAEALKVYFDKLAPGGVLMLHTTNRHIDLWPLIGTQAQALGLVAYGNFFRHEVRGSLLYSSYWVVVGRSEADVTPLVTAEEGWRRLEPKAGARAWSDDYVNMLPYFKMFRD